MAPKINKSLPAKLGLIFGLEVFLITVLFVAALHGPWSYQTWVMENHRSLSWDVTLTKINASVVCDGPEWFQQLCLSVFKRTSGSITSVGNFICDLPTSALSAKPEYHDEIRKLGESCDGMNHLELFSYTTMVLLILSAVSLLLGGMALIRWCYASFSVERKRAFFMAIGLPIFDVLLLIVAVCMYGVGLGSLGKLFVYPSTHGSDQDLIKPVDNGSFGWGFWLAVAALVLHLFLFVFIALWVPRGLKLEAKSREIVKAKALAKRKGEKEPLVKRPVPSKRAAGRSADMDVEAQQAIQPSPSKKVFWAYMPEVMQPDNYLEEQQMYEDEQEYTETTGYGTITTTYMGEPTTVTTTYVQQPGGGYAAAYQS